MVKIRLKKMGMRHQPSFRIVAIESRRPRDGEYLEALGHYNPRSKVLNVNLERVEYWLSKGAQPTDTARKLIRRYAREQQPAPEQPEAVTETQETPAEEPAAETPVPTETPVEPELLAGAPEPEEAPEPADTTPTEPSNE